MSVKGKHAAAAALLLCLADSSSDEDVDKEDTKKCWQATWLKRRKALGFYDNLVRELAMEDSDAYRRLLRMDMDSFNILLELVRPRIKKEDTNFREAISAGNRLTITLRYLATGASQCDEACVFRVAHNTISGIVHQTCKALYEVLWREHLQVPCTKEDWATVSDGFRDKWQFPNCIGALDGKHVDISPPPHSGALYRNYKGRFSIVLMALVDADLKFLCVDVGRNGRMSDSAVWASSEMRAALESNTLNIPEPQKLPNSNTTAPLVIVADEGFGLKDYVMRPYSVRDASRDRKKRVFNYRLSRARRLVESAFGILATKWQIYRAPLRHSPERAADIVRTTVVLHNFLRSRAGGREAYTPPGSVDMEDVQSGEVQTGTLRAEGGRAALQSLSRLAAHPTARATRVRELFKDYFSAEGQVPWQGQVVP